MQDTNETGKALHFGDFQSAILLLDDFIQSLKEKTPEESQITLENWCEMVVEISNFKTQLSIIYNSLTHHLLKEMTETEMVVLSSGDTIEKNGTRTEKHGSIKIQQMQFRKKLSRLLLTWIQASEYFLQKK